MSGATIRSRGWCFTINNYTSDDEHHVFNLAWYSKYVVCGKEVGESGTPHLQGYVYFQDAKTMSAVSAYLPRAHLEKARGTAEENYQYCTKENDYYEYGEKPLEPRDGGRLEKERWELALAAVTENRLEDVPADILGRNLKSLQYAATALKVSKRNLEDTEESMEWYYGESGTGKSRKAREENPGAYLKMCNKWWDGYQGQDVVIIEDFDSDHKMLCHHLKIWADRYPFPAEVKGGKIDIRPRKIIVTSNYRPDDIWTDEKDLDPILRRFHVTKFTKF